MPRRPASISATSHMAAICGLKLRQPWAAAARPAARARARARRLGSARRFRRTPPAASRTAPASGARSGPEELRRHMRIGHAGGMEEQAGVVGLSQTCRDPRPRGLPGAPRTTCSAGHARSGRPMPRSVARHAHRRPPRCDPFGGRHISCGHTPLLHTSGGPTWMFGRAAPVSDSLWSSKRLRPRPDPSRAPREPRGPGRQAQLVVEVPPGLRPLHRRAALVTGRQRPGRTKICFWSRRQHAGRGGDMRRRSGLASVRWSDGSCQPPLRDVFSLCRMVPAWAGAR